VAELGAGGQDLAGVIIRGSSAQTSNQTKAAMPILTQGPDPNPKTPSLRCPPGACDSHIHLFGPAAKYPFAPDRPLARALVRHAPERLLWGSDWPHVNLDGREMPNDGDLVDLLADWVPDEATRRKILVDNPCALYGFPAPIPGTG
jgi:hypothetical protein